MRQLGCQSKTERMLIAHLSIVRSMDRYIKQAPPQCSNRDLDAKLQKEGGNVVEKGGAGGGWW